MNLILLGPPGAGKGTQARVIAEKLEACHVATGDIFRAAMSEGTPLGLKAKGFMNRGELVPDDIVNGIVKERLSMEDCSSGFVLDGYPRTVPQAESLEVTLKHLGFELDAVISIEVPEEILVERATGRRVCRSCGTGWHISFDPPPAPDRCACGGELYQRQDDNEETIRNRVRVYEKNTQPLLGYYERKGCLKRIDGTGTIDDVRNDILDALGTSKK